MQPYREKWKPAVGKPVLLLMAGALWIVAGTILLTFAYHWLRSAEDGFLLLHACAGVALALVIHHFGFLRIVDRNLSRILPMKDKRCLFSFMTWRSYAIVAVMIVMGALLRHSSIPKSYLSVVYTGIGLALILSSIRYLRFVLKQTSGNDTPED